jgi:Tol biopolymer transport system component
MWAVAVACLAASAPPAFAHDHGEILFTSDRAGSPDIWTMSPKGREAVNLTAGSPAADVKASWRPDGRKIVFLSDRATPGNPPRPALGDPTPRSS